MLQQHEVTLQYFESFILSSLSTIQYQSRLSTISLELTTNPIKPSRTNNSTVSFRLSFCNMHRECKNHCENETNLDRLQRILKSVSSNWMGIEHDKTGFLR